ncbi:MAG: DUF4249 family protein [Candidatus Krumholzibacteria bacterium]|nr:DUF4249 family protein [Candidatus Krumholzibacteria bacterium]
MMKHRVLTILSLIAFVVAGASCERELFSPDDVGTLVVNSMLFVDKPFDDIYLYRAQSAETPFDPLKAAERGARVTIRTKTAAIQFREEPGAPGRYTWLGSAPPYVNTVEPETTYWLEIVTRSGETLTATTTTPPRLTVTDWVLLDDLGVTVERRLRTFAELDDSVYYAPENQLIYSEGLLEAWPDPVATAAYQAGIYSIDKDSDFVIDPEFLDEEDFEEFERNISSPPILPSETKIRLPWFAIYFEGRYKIKIFAIDKNWYDLVRSVPELSGGGGFGGNIGDDFERPIFQVDGGIGFFGSASMDSVGFYVHPRQ